MLTTLMLAAGLLAAPEPHAQPPKGTGWIIEVLGHARSRPQQPLGCVRLFPEPMPLPLQQITVSPARTRT